MPSRISDDESLPLRFICRCESAGGERNVVRITEDSLGLSLLKDESEGIRSICGKDIKPRAISAEEDIPVVLSLSVRSDIRIGFLPRLASRARMVEVGGTEDDRRVVLGAVVPFSLKDNFIGDFVGRTAPGGFGTEDARTVFVGLVVLAAMRLVVVAPAAIPTPAAVPILGRSPSDSFSFDPLTGACFSLDPLTCACLPCDPLIRASAFTRRFASFCSGVKSSIASE